jgi:hypothetical protein
MTDRTQITQRVLNLRELAQSSTSEAEAMNAMKAADKLMHSYRLSEAELALAEGLGEVKVEIVDETKFDIGLNVGRVRHKVQSIIWSLEQYCEVEIVLKTRYLGGKQNGINIIGDKPDVEMFWWLLAHLRDAMDRSYNAWKRKQQGVGRGAKASFQLAFAHAVNSRLRDMMSERACARAAAEADAAKLLNRPIEDVRMDVSNGNLRELSSHMSLVVASAAEQKRKAVSEAFSASYKGVRLGTASGFGYASNGNAAQAGRSAGSSVGLGRPVGGGGTRGLLA